MVSELVHSIVTFNTHRSVVILFATVLCRFFLSLHVFIRAIRLVKGWWGYPSDWFNTTT